MQSSDRKKSVLTVLLVASLVALGFLIGAPSFERTETTSGESKTGETERTAREILQNAAIAQHLAEPSEPLAPSGESLCRELIDGGEGGESREETSDPVCKYFKVCGDGEGGNNPRPTRTGDDCYFAGSGKRCGMRQDSPPFGDYTDLCCDVIDGRCDCHQDMANKCEEGTEAEQRAKLLKCLLDGEGAGHPGSNNDCWHKILCTLTTRMGLPDYPGTLSGVITQGDGKQFSPLLCQCDANWSQLFCDCCENGGTPSNSDIGDFVDGILDGSIALDCDGLAPTHYMDTPPDGKSEAETSCTKLVTPDCPHETFWSCPSSLPVIERASESLQELASKFTTVEEFKDALDAAYRQMIEDSK